MKKDKIVSKVLKIIAIIIILIGLWVFFDLRLYRKNYYSDFTYEFKIYLPILVLGFSSTLYGIATLLEKNK